MSDHDVIVVGARCAGAATALHLARKGHKVLLVDRDTFPSDTLSTHFVQIRGASYLNRWGLWDTIAAEVPALPRFSLTREGVALSAEPSLPALRDKLALFADADDAAPYYSAPRRHFLDATLVNAAVDAGAELREGFSVEEPLVEDGVVVGISGRTPGGPAIRERAKLVVLADGRNSRLARALDVPTYGVIDESSYSYYSYWSDLDLSGIPPLIHLRGRLAMALLPTNDNQWQLMVIGPGEWATAFKTDVEASFLRHCELVVPGIGERLSDPRATRTDRFEGIVKHPVFLRKTYGPGYALVGDAALSLDQITAMGITFAFRDSELVASAADSWLAGDQEFDAAFGRYHELRDEDTTPYYEFTAFVAKLLTPTPADMAPLLAMHGNEDACAGFFAAFQDLVPLSALGEPPDPEAFADHPEMVAFKERVAGYDTVPFGDPATA
jgi:2-polyprenyl-6-methoxyphenol hydroxylase-like FAD-dependent oxidoreductase